MPVGQDEGDGSASLYNFIAEEVLESLHNRVFEFKTGKLLL